MIEGSMVRVTMNTENKDRPSTAFIGRLAAIDYGGAQVFGRWHRKDLKDDGHKELPIGKVDTHTFFPWTSVDHIEVLPESGQAETDYAEHLRVGMQALKSKDYAAALQHFRAALALKPEDQKSRYYLDEAERLSQS